MSDVALELWKFAPVVVLLLVAIWAGHKGFWYWGPNAQRVIEDIKRDRDHWRELAMKLLKEREAEDGEPAKE